MARRDDVLGVAGAETVIGAGVTVEGQLHGEGDIVVDGTLTGDIKSEGDVTIGVNAVVRSNISGNNVTIQGDVRGNVMARGETSIGETGQLQGNVTAAGLAIASGGVFIGQSRLQRAPRLGLDDVEEA